jgi:hypothetical protein
MSFGSAPARSETVPSHGGQPPASPAPTRARPPGWLDLRLVMGVLLVLGSVVLGARVVSGADDRDPVWRTSHSIAAGTVLTAEDLEVSRVELGDARGYVSAAQDLVGRIAVRDLGAGELVTQLSVDDAAASTTVTIPVAAVNTPPLVRGQRIAVWVSTDACQGAVVLRDAAVQGIADDRGGFSAASQIAVVVRVEADLALRVVQALDLPNAVIRVGLIEGAAAPTGELPDLAPCTGGR